MIIDTHAHFIQPPLPDRPYVDQPKVEPLSVDELILRADEAGVDRILQVTMSTMGYDNRYSFEGARARPERIIGVVGRVDPLSDRVEEHVQRFSAEPEALGIRITLFHDWARNWLVDRALDRFLAAAARFDVPVHICAPGQNLAMIKTAEYFPEVRFIIDHMGTLYTPGLSAREAFSQWPELIRLAALPNVWIKVSHFPEAAMETESHPWPTAIDYFRQLYEQAGASRLMWGSNFPVVLRACSYKQALDFIRSDCDFLSADDRTDILGGNFLRDFVRKAPGHTPATE